ncbi:MAG: type II toxin-antitoxin system prevent-host-death family antitoxin [Actinomycetota bacterium]
MSAPEREIPERELRNHIGEVLREVAAGKHLRVTIRGRAVADLVPVRLERRFATRAEVERILRETPLDAKFADDVDRIVGATIEEM